MAKMVQVFMVVRCYSCETFQVHQVKKTNKWVCKVCNEKQSVVKVFGKGNAADCRKHVQKMNMMRGQEEAKKVAALENTMHPPEDYASTFQTDDRQQPQLSHPVLIEGGESRWTTFIEPQDSNSEDSDGEETYTTDRDEFVQAHKKQRKEIRRRSSDIYPISKSARTNLPTRSSSSKVNKGRETVYPYSSVSRKMEMLLDEQPGRLTTSKSCYMLNSSQTSERYTRLDDDTFVYEEGQAISQSMQNLSKFSSSHEEQMAVIRKDISRYSRQDLHDSKAASRWDKFIREEESNSEDDELPSTHEAQDCLEQKPSLRQVSNI